MPWNMRLHTGAIMAYRGCQFDIMSPIQSNKLDVVRYTPRNIGQVRNAKFPRTNSHEQHLSYYQDAIKTAESKTAA